MILHLLNVKNTVLKTYSGVADWTVAGGWLTIQWADPLKCTSAFKLLASVVEIRGEGE